ncbi:DUF423 domain-containing protein [Ferruginibacter albus]|nr:DUF423 domain-containing protein [Ferruginibacter albus]
MNKNILLTAALLGAVAVMLGAFAAHGLKQMIRAEQIEIFQKGVTYQFYHVFALLAVGILYKEVGNNLLKWSARLFTAGIVFFSGSLYYLAFFEADAPPSPKWQWLYLITPLGGLCFIVGWLLLALAVAKNK